MDKKTIFMIALPPLLIVMLFITALIVPFEMTLSGVEQEILRFWNDDLKIQEQDVRQISDNLPSPIVFRQSDLEKAIENKGKGEGSALKEPNDLVNMDISLIVISGKSKMAMIRGVPVKEGDMIADMKVERIEPDRVLIKNKTSRWIEIGR